jgi:CheY-like chemotaxis protein
MAATILADLGYTVLEAGDGEEALRVAADQAGQIQLLITDVVMPRMGGRQLADRLRQARPQIKVLFTSGYTDDAIVRHGVLEPGIALLQKPFLSTALARKVREVLGGPAPTGQP